MQADLRYLCSERLQGRASLAPGAELAASYIASAFEKAGLAPAAPNRSFMQRFPLVALPKTSRATLTLIRAGAHTEFRPGSDYRTSLWQALHVSAAVAFVGYGISAPEYGYDDYAGIDVAGKVVLVFDHEPQETDPRSVFNGTGHTRYANSHVKSETAKRHGALALMIVSEPLRKHSGTFDATAVPAGKASLRASAPRQAADDSSIPVFSISDGTAVELLRTSGRTPAELQTAIDHSLKPASTVLPDTTVEFSSPAAEVQRGQSANVAGWLEGADPQLRRETIMITAHYDHLGVQNGRLYPGANDNASGSVAVMELARWFAGDARRTRRSLLFVVFGSEEEGLLGSYYYVANPLRPLATTRAVLNLDMIARDEAHIPQSQGVVEIPPDTRNQINVVGAFYSPELEAAIRKANQKTGFEISTKFDRDHDLNVLFRCDHFPFLLHDVPAVWVFGGFHPGYHEPSDTIDQLNFPKLEKVVRLAYESVKSLADAVSAPDFQAASRR
jgi:Zn-dependent M28 family amino/carboxypeptidase